MKKRKITDAIVVHCSATPEGRDHSASDIRRWHLNRGFEDIGYHYIIRIDGTVEVGRSEELVGAHCPDGSMNSRSVGVCYVGGMDREMRSARDTRTEAQRRSLRGLVERLQRKYNISRSRVFGHRDFAAKACPSFDVRTGLCLGVIMLTLVACSPRTVVHTDRVVERDTLNVVAVRNDLIEIRDTFILRERPDSIIKESIRWRVRDRVAHDTLLRVVRDTVISARVDSAGGESKGTTTSRIAVFLRGVVAGAFLLAMIRLLLYIRKKVW